ncbi:type VII secretion protein EsaA [Bacillus mangrovi]|uniref:Type VII secretion protein EsaA n=1 Tax=Metabacillus mangrovi TaxID=1491830 RepID=A0A7X2S589_9BACI|nr:type VII secretion protein EsaA [Metabacillus mangrovi]MTH53958.1 type VII secretion protein EsaA [Metabacillus mangrovi]
MKEQTKYMVKMILAVILILAVPALFFQTIGENPMEVQDKATRTIAVVNEDVATDEDPLQFGKVVAQVMGENSDYEWKSLGRSAAESGMRNKELDAVVYIPSDFTNNVLTYDETEPINAEFEFAIQNQLTAIDKERVLRTIENATDTANKRTAVYYWDSVAQEMDDVKKKFDSILDKESQFQETMIAFYKPSSKDLSGEIDSQKQMLVDLQKTMTDAAKTAPESEQNAEQFEADVQAFVKAVGQYQDYQRGQLSLMNDLQTETAAGIQETLANQSSLTNENLELMTVQTEALNTQMSGIDTILQAGADQSSNIDAVLEEQISRQFVEMKNLQAEYLAFYRTTSTQLALNEVEQALPDLKAVLATAPEPDPENPDPENPDPDPENPDPENPENPETPDTPENPDTPDPETPETPGTPDPENPGGENPPADPGQIASTKEQQEAIRAIADQASLLQQVLDALPEPKLEELVNAAGFLGDLSGQAAEIEKQLSEKDLSNQEFQKAYDELKADLDTIVKSQDDILKENERLLAENKDLTDRIGLLSLQITNLSEEVKETIAKKEQAILASESLSDERKEKLKPVFDQPVQNDSLQPVLNYYSKLEQYEAVLNSIKTAEDPAAATVLANEELNNKTVAALVPTDKEFEFAESITSKFPSAQMEVQKLQETTNEFLQQNSTSIAEQQNAMLDEMTQIQTNAGELLQQINGGAAVPGEPPVAEAEEGLTEGTSLVSGTTGVTSAIDQMNSLMDSLGERQASVVGYTDNLYKKVDEVQAQSDELNDKWATNVAATKLSRDQVFEVLDNTRKDGQDNGYVYNHLANPIQISGEEPVEQAKVVPPVVILVIVLLSSLLIGYFSGVYFKAAPFWLRATLFILLNVIVGLLISLFGTSIYNLADDRAIQWTLFTILLLLTASSLIRVAFLFGSTPGMLASVGLTAFFVSPLLALTVPNFSYSDPISNVYISIQEDTENLFTEGSLILIGIFVILTVIPFIGKAIMDSRSAQTEEV